MTFVATAPLLLAATVAAPLLLALPAARTPRTWRWLAPLATVPALLAAVLLADGATLDLPWLLLGARFGLDGPARLLLLASAIVWLAAGIHATTGNALRARRTRAGFLLAMAGNFGVVLAHDPAGFFAWYALMSFSAYLLVVERDDGAARRAGRVYVVLVVLGEVLILSGLLAAVHDGEPHAAAAARWLLWLGFGIKAGLVPLHFGLPLAYQAASTAGAAALAGAMVNAGLAGWLRFLTPQGMPAEGLGLSMIAVGLIGALYGAAVGVTQRNAGALLGYSSVSQMGLIAVGVGAGLVVPAAWPATVVVVALYAAHHALAKAALFIGVGVTAKTGARPTWLALLIPASALVGLPLTSGWLAKAALKLTVPVLPSPWPGILEIGLPLAAVGTTLLMARLLFLAAPDDPAPSPVGRQWLAYALLLLAVLLGPWWLGRAPALTAAASWLAALWPALVGGLIAGAVFLASRRGPRRALPEIPPGDVLLPLERAASRLWQQLTPAPEAHPATGEGSPAGTRFPQRLAHLLSRGERLLTRWECAALAVVTLALATAATLLAR